MMTVNVTETSTRKVDNHVNVLACDSELSKSTASQICVDIACEAAPVRRWVLDRTVFDCLCLGATYVKACVEPRVVSGDAGIALLWTREPPRPRSRRRRPLVLCVLGRRPRQAEGPRVCWSGPIDLRCEQRPAGRSPMDGARVALTTFPGPPASHQP